MTFSTKEIQNYGLVMLSYEFCLEICKGLSGLSHGMDWADKWKMIFPMGSVGKWEMIFPMVWLSKEKWVFPMGWAKKKVDE